MSDDKLNIDELNLFGDQEETFDMVSMTDEDGRETDFFVMDGIDIEKAEDFDKDEPEAFIFKEVASGDDECTYEPVEDDAEYNRVLIMLQNEDAEYEMKL